MAVPLNAEHVRKELGRDGADLLLRPSPELRIAIRRPLLRFLSFSDPFVQQRPWRPAAAVER